jgi:hypothetical protein
MFQIWTLLIGLLMLGLIAPFMYQVFTSSAAGVSDQFSQIILTAGVPIFFFIFVFAALFIWGRQPEDQYARY